MVSVDTTRGGSMSETVDMKLEVMVIPVSDVERAKAFYQGLGWRLDVTPPSVVQLTPPGSSCSLQFGETLSSAAPGSGKGYLIVDDIDAARELLVSAGVAVRVYHLGPDGPIDGPDPERRSYGSWASFSDPDGNSWVFQEITTRLPGRVDSGVTSFGSTHDLADALRRAAAAYGEDDDGRPDRYPEYLAREQTGEELPA